MEKREQEMNNDKRELLNSWIISVLLGLVIWIFFGMFYRHHLHYQEQLQLFLNTSDYLMSAISRPGGLAGYLSGFIIQFFYDSFLGAFMLALLLVVLQRLVLDAANSVARKPVYEILTCLPSLGYAILFLNEDFLLSGLIALLFSMGAVAVFNRIKISGVRLVYMVVMVPILYWLIGIGCITFLLLTLFLEWTCEEKRSTALLIGVSILSVSLFILSPVLSKMIVVQYPLRRFWMAGDYYRFVSVFDIGIYSVFLLPVLIAALYLFLPYNDKRKANLLKQGVQLFLICSILFVAVTRMADWRKEELMGYDYYSRMGRWNNIIAMADRKSPEGPLTVATLNLALSKTGHMPDYMFTYFQNGPEGLIPDFQKNFIESMMIGEIYYHLGLINTAQHFAFEATEAIPDYQKSVRCIKRLAETNLINGQYAVAAKYLNLLKHTFAYRKWATETMAYLGDEERIDTHPEWGKLRQFRPKDDFLFSEGEKDMMIGILFQDNPTNYMAYEYLLAYTLLTKDIERFYQYYRLGEGKVVYRVIPRSYQEAMAYIWSLTNNNQPPLGIDPLIIERLNAFLTTYRNIPQAEPILRKDFEDTYWYYFYYRRN